MCWTWAWADATERVDGWAGGVGCRELCVVVWDLVGRGGGECGLRDLDVYVI